MQCFAFAVWYTDVKECNMAVLRDPIEGGEIFVFIVLAKFQSIVQGPHCLNWERIAETSSIKFCHGVEINIQLNIQ